MRKTHQSISQQQSDLEQLLETKEALLRSNTFELNDTKRLNRELQSLVLELQLELTQFHGQYSRELTRLGVVNGSITGSKKSTGSKLANSWPRPISAPAYSASTTNLDTVVPPPLDANYRVSIGGGQDVGDGEESRPLNQSSTSRAMLTDQSNPSTSHSVNINDSLQVDEIGVEVGCSSDSSNSSPSSSIATIEPSRSDCRRQLWIQTRPSEHHGVQEFASACRRYILPDLSNPRLLSSTNAWSCSPQLSRVESVDRMVPASSSKHMPPACLNLLRASSSTSRIDSSQRLRYKLLAQQLSDRHHSTANITPIIDVDALIPSIRFDYTPETDDDSSLTKLPIPTAESGLPEASSTDDLLEGIDLDSSLTTSRPNVAEFYCLTSPQLGELADEASGQVGEQKKEAT